jgi:hypothetical protein
VVPVVVGVVLAGVALPAVAVVPPVVVVPVAGVFGCADTAAANSSEATTTAL